MHELSIAMNILELVADEVGRRGLFGNVQAIRVRIGPLSGVITEALVSAFAMAREDTPYERTNLVVEETSIIIRCGMCGAEAPPMCINDLRCTACNNDGSGEASEILSGRELEITALELTA